MILVIPVGVVIVGTLFIYLSGCTLFLWWLGKDKKEIKNKKIERAPQDEIY